MASEEKQGEKFDPESCFVKWRGEPDQHRYNDVVIKSSQADSFRQVLAVMHEMGETKLHRPQVSGGKMRVKEEGIKMRFSAMIDDERESLEFIEVVSGDGAKFVVREDAGAMPATIAKLRNQADFEHQKIIDRIRPRVELIGGAIIKELDDEKVLDRAADVRDMYREIIRIPLAGLPPGQLVHGRVERSAFCGELRSFIGEWLNSKMPPDKKKLSIWTTIEGEEVVISAMRSLR